MLLIVGLVGCASGGRPFEPPGDQPGPDAPKSPDDPPDPPVPPIDAPEAPTDSTVLPPDGSGPCTPVSTERLANPALDLAPVGTGWSEVPLQNVPGGPYAIISADGPTSSAPNGAWLGGFPGEQAVPAASTLTDQLFQDVTFPADATTFVVSGMFLVGTNEFPFGIVFDTFSLAVTETNGSPIETVLQLDNTDDGDSYAGFSKTLTSNLAGRTVRLRATSTNDSTDHTNFFLDSLSFKATFCP
jgi:hypothetical protein